MTETTAGALAQVTELDEERRRYVGWLTQLEERRGTTPAHVFERVHGDYSARLEGVLARLAEHAGMLRGAVEDLARRVEELSAEERRCADERAEGELRAAVGEYTVDQWAEIEQRTDATMADLVAERQQVESEHSRLEQVLQLAAPAASADDAAASGAAAAAEPAEVGGAETSAAADGEPEEMAATAGATFDASDLVPDIVPVEALAPDVGPKAPVAPAPAAMDAGAWTHGLGLGSGGGGGGGRGGLGAPPSQLEGARLLDGLLPTGPSPIAADGGGTPQVKTLKCQECGTMNYPTEWYCERCGGELAAL